MFCITLTAPRHGHVGCQQAILLSLAEMEPFTAFVQCTKETVAACNVPCLQAATLWSDVMCSGLGQAQGGVRLLRLPWLIVEAQQDLKCNRDGEPSPPSKRWVRVWCNAHGVRCIVTRLAFCVHACAMYCLLAVFYV